ncbi:MAG: DUF4135 domain-containing protein [Pseudomonadota bacterium]
MIEPAAHSISTAPIGNGDVILHALDALTGPLVQAATETLGEQHPNAAILAPEALASAQAHLREQLAQRAYASVRQEYTLHCALQGTFPWPHGAAETDATDVSFLTAMTHGGLNEILGRLPGLRELLNVAVQDWVRATALLANRFCEDWDRLRFRFGLLDIKPRIAALQTGLGDPHDGGQTVAILTTGCGGKLVYKPRSLDMDHALGRLLTWVNGEGYSHPFAILDIDARSTDYGWAACSGRADCASPDDTAVFFHRAGGLLCLAGILQATDLHRENIIAVGSNPVIVDAETFFQPRISRENEQDWNCPDHLLRDTGMLPPFGAKTSSDFSALCSVPGTRTGILLTHKNARYHLPAGDHLPYVNGAPQTARAHITDLLHGFCEMFALIAHSRTELLEEDGPLQQFRGARGRFVARGTQVYGSILGASYAPEHLREINGRRNHLASALNALTTEQPGTDPIRRAEVDALLRGDVPHLQFQPDRIDWPGTGAPPFDQVRARIKALRPDQVDQWTRTIQKLLTSPAPSEPASDRQI